LYKSPETTVQEKDMTSIEYLRHSGFYINFSNEVSVLTDYGKPNAYKQWGWSSPIRNMGILSPDILTYSLRHDDHFDPERIEGSSAIRYFGDSIFRFGNL
jgi:L-ascorbate metabolism protein UlaG (beta-lactamase superfamily)